MGEDIVADAEAMTVSAIVPVYNVAKYFPLCMESIAKQSRPFDEVVLVDDGSEDESGRLCDEYANKYENVRVIHKKNGGLSSARNEGIKAAACGWITFIDSDDWISLDYNEVLCALASKYEADLAMCGIARTGNRSLSSITVAAQDFPIHVYDCDEFAKVLLRVQGNRTIHYAPAKLYRRDLLEDEQFPVGILNEDVESAFKVTLRVNRVVETTSTGYFYYFNPNSITGATFGENYLNLSEVWQRIYDIAKLSGTKWLPAVELNLKRADFTILCDALVHGSRETDAKYAKELGEHLKKLRGNIGFLLRSPIATNRKLAILLVTAFYKPTRFAVRAIKRK